MLFLFIYFSGKKRAIATTNPDNEDNDAPRYVCILAGLLPMHRSAFSPYATPKKARTKELLTPSKSIKSAFVFIYLLVLSWDINFLFHSGKKCAVVISDSDNEDVFVPRYVLCIIF